VRLLDLVEAAELPVEGGGAGHGARLAAMIRG
jgi:hypothetical protein